MEQTFEIMIDHLVADQEFRHAFIQTPGRALRESADWGVPLCDSELYSRLAAGQRGLERLAYGLGKRLLAATN